MESNKPPPLPSVDIFSSPGSPHDCVGFVRGQHNDDYDPVSLFKRSNFGPLETSVVVPFAMSIMVPQGVQMLDWATQCWQDGSNVRSRESPGPPHCCRFSCRFSTLPRRQLGIPGRKRAPLAPIPGEAVDFERRGSIPEQKYSRSHPRSSATALATSGGCTSAGSWDISDMSFETIKICCL